MRPKPMIRGFLLATALAIGGAAFNGPQFSALGNNPDVKIATNTGTPTLIRPAVDIKFGAANQTDVVQNVIKEQTINPDATIGDVPIQAASDQSVVVVIASTTKWIRNNEALGDQMHNATAGNNTTRDAHYLLKTGTFDFDEGAQAMSQTIVGGAIAQSDTASMHTLGVRKVAHDDHDAEV